jgi:hypothetical protein
MKQKTQLFTILILLILCTLNVRSQDNSNARSVGMSFGSLTSSFGVDAYGINPANYDYHKLSLKKKPGTYSINNNSKVLSKNNKFKQSFEISLLSAGGGYGSDNSFKFYNDYTQYLSVNYTDMVNFFTDLNSTIDFKTNVLPNEQTNVDFNFELKWLSLNYSNPDAGAFNVTVSDKIRLESIVSGKDEFLNFQTTSNPNGSYNMNNFILNQKESSAWWIRKYTAGYGKQFDFAPKSFIKSISIGFSAALVHGYGSIRTSNLSLSGDSWGIQNINGVNHADSITGSSQHFIQTSSTDFFRGYNDAMHSKFSFFPKPAGKGYSFDIGIALQVTDYVRVAASVVELGKIKWDYNTFVSNDNNSFAYYDLYLTEDDPTYQQLLNDIRGVEGRDSNVVYETDMPAKYRAGISYKPSEIVLLEFNWLNEKSILPGKAAENLYSIAGEISPVPVLPLRAGFSFGGDDDFNISLGAGIKLEHFVLDVGLYGLNQLILGKRFLAALSTKLVF